MPSRGKEGLACPEEEGYRAHCFNVNGDDLARFDNLLLQGVT